MDRSDWFESLTGFREGPYAEPQSRFAVQNDRLVSRVNGQSWTIGKFEMTSLATLRGQVAQISRRRGRPKVSVIQGDIRRLHAKPPHREAALCSRTRYSISRDTATSSSIVSPALDRPCWPPLALNVTDWREAARPLSSSARWNRTFVFERGLAESGMTAPGYGE